MCLATHSAAVRHDWTEREKNDSRSHNVFIRRTMAQLIGSRSRNKIIESIAKQTKNIFWCLRSSVSHRFSNCHALSSFHSISCARFFSYILWFLNQKQSIVGRNALVNTCKWNVFGAYSVNDCGCPTKAKSQTDDRIRVKFVHHPKLSCDCTPNDDNCNIFFLLFFHEWIDK